MFVCFSFSPLRKQQKKKCLLFLDIRLRQSLYLFEKKNGRVCFLVVDKEAEGV